MADDLENNDEAPEIDEIKKVSSDAMESAESDSSEGNAAESGDAKKAPAEPIEIKNQFFGIILLIVVVAILWGVVKGLEPLSAWLGDTVEKALPTQTDDSEKADAEGDDSEKTEASPKEIVEEKTPDEEKPKPKSEPIAKATKEDPVPLVQPERVDDAPEITAPVDPSQPISKAAFQEQLIEQLGEGTEVRHLAFSEDGSKLVTSLKMVGKDGTAKLMELFFERDEFGRYVTTEDSPLDEPVKVYGRSN